MENLTADTFKTKVFDFAAGKEWKFAGSRPCIVDFYADWCGPCRSLAPTLAGVAEKYSGKIDIYKVNVDEEQAIASAFGVQSIPTLLFVPLSGKPQISLGALPKETLESAIGDVLGVK